MVVFAVLFLWMIILVSAVAMMRATWNYQRTQQRFIEATLDVEATQTNSLYGDTTNTIGNEVAPDGLDSVKSSRRLYRKWIWLPWVFGLVIALTVWLVFRWPVQYVLAMAIVCALLLNQLESFLYSRQVSILERQLADAIDIMVGAVSAGAALGPAMDAATVETDRPLKPYLQEIAGRIRLGDEPIAVFRSLAERVPLETFLLFSSSLAVHYEVGGRLAPTLATVGRTIRDRIEVTRRIQSNIAQSQFSTFAILGLIYLIALIVWRNGPEPMRDFVTSTAGSWFVAGSIIMQAVGIVWMNLISKPRF